MKQKKSTTSIVLIIVASAVSLFLVLIIGLVGILYMTVGTADQSVKFSLKIYVDDYSANIYDLNKGDSCDGSDVSEGYGDINNTAQLVVRNPDTESVISRSKLGQGVVSTDGGRHCEFTANVELKEGKSFLFEINDGDRGSYLATWEELQEDPTVSLSLGD